MISYRWTSTILAMSIAAVIIWLVRHNHLHARNAAWWILVALAVAIIGVFPELVDWIAIELGVSYPPTLATLIGMAVILLKMLKSDIEQSKERQQIRILIQKIAVLESRIQFQENNNSDLERVETRE